MHELLWSCASASMALFATLFVLASCGLAAAILLIVRTRTENDALSKENRQLNEMIGSRAKGPTAAKQKSDHRDKTSGSYKSTHTELTAMERASQRKKRTKGSKSHSISPQFVAVAIDEDITQQRVPQTSRLFTGQTAVNSTNLAPSIAPPVKRSTAERVARSFTPNEFAEAMHHTVDFINQYIDHPEDYSVTTKLPPWSLVAALPKAAPLYPEEYKVVLDDLKKLVMPMFTHWQHPRFLAYFPHGRTHADILAMALEAAFAVVGFSYDSCPALTELEVVTANWLADCFGLPKGFHWNIDDIPGSPGGGFYLPSASDAVFAVVMAARDWKFERILKKFHEGKLDKRVDADHHRSNKHDLRHEICQRMVVYASKDAHSCLELACKMAMVRCHPVQATAENDWGITGAQLESAIEQDLAAGLVPFHIHLTLGTTSTASSDHLNTIWPVARKYKMWLHVDAAYAGGAWVEPKYRLNTEGLAHATSVNINCNKFFMHVSPGSILWTQDKDTFKQSFSLTPPYLKPLKSNTMDLRDFGVQLTRTFRSLRTWILMRTTGVEGLRHYINRMIDLSAHFEELIKQHPNVRPFCRRNYGLFCFFYSELNMSYDECNAATRTLAGYINDTHELFITRSNVGGQEIIRISINYINSTRQTIEKNVEILKKIIDDFRDHWVVFKHGVSLAPTPLEGRNTRPGPAIYDIDLKGTPLPDIDPKTVEYWAETPNPITRQESVKEIYRLPQTPLTDMDTTQKAKGNKSEEEIHITYAQSPVNRPLHHSGNSSAIESNENLVSPTVATTLVEPTTDPVSTARQPPNDKSAK